MDEYKTLNKAKWDERAPAHAASEDYGVAEFISDPSHLSRVVEFDRDLLGDIRGMRGVHLQCHIGTDTLSLARLGATMSGLDFSGASLDVARDLARAAHTDIEYHQADVYDATDVFAQGSFDLVYTGIGALCWIPRMRPWAAVVAALLKPGGRLFLRELHPVMLSLGDPRPDGLMTIEYPYFEREEPLVFDEPYTYVETEVIFTQSVSHEWNHGLGDIITALLEAGMELTGLVEHNSSPAEGGLSGQMRRLSNGEWQLNDRPWRVPFSYTLQAVKRW